MSHTMGIMGKGITLWNPWAMLVALGHKKFETRSWKTPYRGLLAIHAAKRWDRRVERLAPKAVDGWRLQDQPMQFGKVLCICELVECHIMTNRLINAQTPKEIAVGDWQQGRYAWELKLIKVLDEPIPFTGRQGLWNWDMPNGLVEAVRL